MSFIEKQDQKVFEAIQKEFNRQNKNIELIASENFVSKAVMEAQGSVLTNKYAEGFPHKRYYGGCEYVDIVEDLARDRAKAIFGAEHANVQPHSGSQANMAVYRVALNHGDTVLGMDLSHGGHLTHGSPVNFSGIDYKFVAYGVDKATETIQYDEVRRLAHEHKPKLIIAGASAYSRAIDFEQFKIIADEVGAKLMVDMAHIAGLVAVGLHQNPVPYADFVTTTTHKTLRGPRGGMILCKEAYAKAIDKAIFPGIQGGPLMHVIAAKAVAFGEAMQPEFKDYQTQVMNNAKAMVNQLQERGLRIISGGTDNHVFTVDVSSIGLTGKIAEHALDAVHITTNKNTIPFDTNSPFITSGIRIGTPAVTTRGLKEKEMIEIANVIADVLADHENEAVLQSARARISKITDAFPLHD